MKYVKKESKSYYTRHHTTPFSRVGNFLFFFCLFETVTSTYGKLWYTNFTMSYLIFSRTEQNSKKFHFVFFAKSFHVQFLNFHSRRSFTAKGERRCKKKIKILCRYNMKIKSFFNSKTETHSNSTLAIRLVIVYFA